MTRKEKNERLLDRVVPAAGERMEEEASVAGQRAVPAEVEDLGAALTKLENCHNAWGAMMPDKLEEAMWIAIGVLRDAIRAQRRKSSTGGNGRMSAGGDA